MTLKNGTWVQRSLRSREWLVATDPSNDSVSERFDGWICSGKILREIRGRVSEAEFPAEVLKRLARWRAAVSA